MATSNRFGQSSSWPLSAETKTVKTTMTIMNTEHADNTSVSGNDDGCIFARVMPENSEQVQRIHVSFKESQTIPDNPSQSQTMPDNPRQSQTIHWKLFWVTRVFQINTCDWRTWTPSSQFRLRGAPWRLPAAKSRNVWVGHLWTIINLSTTWNALGQNVAMCSQTCVTSINTVQNAAALSSRLSTWWRNILKLRILNLCDLRPFGKVSKCSNYGIIGWFERKTKGSESCAFVKEICFKLVWTFI